MQMVIANIQPKKWPAVREALCQVEVERMTVMDVLGYADTPTGNDRLGFPKKLSQIVWIEILVNDDFLERTVDTIARVARTGSHGQPGDGKIFVIPVDNVIRVQDGSEGKGAV